MMKYAVLIIRFRLPKKTSNNFSSTHKSHKLDLGDKTTVYNMRFHKTNYGAILNHDKLRKK